MAAAEQLLVFPVKVEQQGTVRRRPTVRKQLVPFRSNQAQAGWLISSVRVKLGADMKTEERRGLLLRDMNCHLSSQPQITFPPGARLEMTAPAPAQGNDSNIPPRFLGGAEVPRYLF